MATKIWVIDALQILADSLSPVPHELNELDWKAALSHHRDRLTEHLIAFANHPNGGYLVFGLDNDVRAVGVEQAQVADSRSSLRIGGASPSRRPGSVQVEAPERLHAGRSGRS
jgi:hypothetical protein